jgi:hypothetical protein
MWWRWTEREAARREMDVYICTCGEVQSYRVTEVQRRRDAEVQRWRGTELLY